MRLWKIFTKTIEYSFYALFFATPLLFNPSRSFPSFELFEWNKMVFVYLVTATVVAAWIGRMILEKKLIIRRTPFDLPLLLFLGSAALSTLFSIDRHVSIFGYYSRFHGGLLSTVSYILLYYAFTANFELVNLRKLLLFTLSSGMVVAIYGVAERFGIDANMWVQDVRARVFSTLGQPNWLAAYLAILLPIAVYKLLTDFKVIGNSEKKAISSQLTADSFIWKLKTIGLLPALSLSKGILVFIFYLCLLFTKSRSGLLGFWVADMLFWVGLAISIKFKSRLSRPDRESVILDSRLRGNDKQGGNDKSNKGSKRLMKQFLMLHASFFILNFFVRTPFSQYNRFLTTDVFSNQPVKEETTAPVGDSVINVGITDSAEIRRIVWKGALDIAKAYPLFGTGPETFAYAYYKFRPLEHNLTSEWDFLYNRAHNEFLNIVATQGILGLAIYLFLIATVLIWTFKKIYSSYADLLSAGSPKQLRGVNTDPKSSKRSILQTANFNHRTLILALLGAYLSILVTNFFGFSVVVIGLYFYLIPGWLYVSTKSSTTAAPQITLSTRRAVIIAGVTLVFAVAIFTLGRWWIADSIYAKALSSSRQENYPEAYPNIITATKLRESEPVYHDERANIAGNLALLAIDSNEATLAAQLAQEAVQESTLAIKISPQNVNFWKTRTRIFYLLGATSPEFNQNALATIQIAEELAPTDAKIRYNEAIILGRLQKNTEAIDTLKKTLQMKPDYRDAYIALSIFYQEQKNSEAAREILQEALRRVNPDDAEIKQRLENLK